MNKFQTCLTGLLIPFALSCVRDLSTPEQFYSADTYTDSPDSSLQRRNDNILDFENDTLRLEDIIIDTNPEDTPLIYDIPDSISLPEIISDATVPEILPDTPFIDTAPELKIDAPSEITLPEITQETTIPDIPKDIPSKNNPPQLLPVENKMIAEGQPLSFSITATDTENDPVTYLNLTETSLPNFSLNPKTGEITFQPPYTSIKHPQKEQTISLKFSAYDGKEYSKPITLNVLIKDTNQIPHFTSNIPLNVLIDQEYTYTLTAEDKEKHPHLEANQRSSRTADIRS